MVNKVLKTHLWLLFALAAVNAIYYAFHQYLPDSSLVITGNDKDINTISYYISSFISVVSYYVGAWVVAPFVGYFFIYFTLLNKRTKEWDIFVPGLLCGFFFSLTFLFFPGFLGKGLLHASNKVFDSYILFAMTLVFGFFVALITMRGAFWESLKNSQAQLGQVGMAGGKVLKLSYDKASSFAERLQSKERATDLKVKAAKLIKNGLPKPKALEAPKNILSENKLTSKFKKKNTESVAKAATKENENISNKLGVNDSVPTFEDQSEPIVDANRSSIDFSWGDGEDSKVVPVNKAEAGTIDDIKGEEIVPQRAKAQQSTPFFASKDLINCISDNTEHAQVASPDQDYFDCIIQTIEGKLQEFKITGSIINILKGPVVDTFELDLGEGIKASKVKGLEDDLGLALNGSPIRVVYPLKGRSTIGIEVPRNPREFIYLDEVLQTPVFNETKKRLPIAMGKDAFGEVSVVDLAGMPHMLVAGATGAGKSVFVNTMLVSLIIKKSPKELKLILIDPKQLELAVFSDLPHLMLPVITEAKSASIALLWAIEEMERRYTILKEMGVKNIDGFNRKLKTTGPSVLWKISQYYKDGDENGYELPYIVIVIDEFADLILTKSGKEIELNVNRLAAKARAAGIHLVLATQRPSTDVITGVIKANFPTRVAFTVTNGHDSRTILDQYGAEKLLKNGDMLYKQGIELLRLHSSYVDETEIETLVEKLSQIPSDFNQDAVEFLENEGEEESAVSESAGNFVSGTSDDPVYQEALQVVTESGSASASMLQRRLRVGYNRAANIIDELERNGVVGPAQGSKPRKVLAKSE